MGQWAYYIAVPPAAAERVRANPASMYDEWQAVAEARPGAEFTAEKAWVAIAYLLREGPARSDPRLKVLAGGGTWLPEEQTGLMLPRVFSPGEAGELAAALAGVSDADLLAGYDPARMNESGVYPLDWGGDPAWDRNYIRQWFRDVVDGFSRAAADGMAVLARVG